jgi:phosphoserine phosphatase RsbU/P
VAIEPSSAQASHRPSLRWKILVPLNVAMVVIVGAFLAWDAVTEWRTLLVEKRISLADEAETVLSALLLHPNDPVETRLGFVNRVCSRAQATSPGHRIAVQTARGQVLQAGSPQQNAAMQLKAMQEGAARYDGQATAEGRQIIVGSATRGEATAWASEPLDDVAQILNRQITRRVASLLALALVLGIVLNLLVTRLVTRPLMAVVNSVRNVKAGRLGAKTPQPRTAELAYLADEFNAMSTALADADRERRLQMEKARLIQQHLLPSCAADTGLKLSCTYEPASEVGGDYFDIRRHDGRLLFCVADMAGHGVPAAMGAAVLKTLLVQATERSGEPEAILASVGRGMAEVLVDEDFASMFVAAVDPEAGRLWYASAGHPPAYLLRPGRPIVQLDATGPLLGIADAAQWETTAWEIHPGDRLLVMTDGLMETVSPQEELLGAERLAALVEEHRGASLQEMCMAIIDRVKLFRGSAPQADDLTLLGVEF